jgi:uncharacterized protein YegP (UPF0339 family)
VAHFEVFKDKAGQWRYRVRADNGEVVAQSEAYTTEESAKRATRDLVGVTLLAKDQPIQEADE